MKYIMVIRGAGEGCDYTLGCNLRVDEFDADDDAAVLARVGDVLDLDIGEGGNSGALDSITVYAAARQIAVDLTAVRAGREMQRRAADEAKARAEYERLRARFEGDR